MGVHQLKVYKVANISEKFEGLCPINWQKYLQRITPYETRGAYDLKNGDLIQAFVIPCDKQSEDGFDCNDRVCTGRLSMMNGVIYCQHYFEEVAEAKEIKKPARRIELNWE